MKILRVTMKSNENLLCHPHLYAKLTLMDKHYFTTQVKKHNLTAFWDKEKEFFLYIDHEINFNKKNTNAKNTKSGTIDLKIEVYDKQHNKQDRLLGIYTNDIKEWIANERFEGDISLKDPNNDHIDVGVITLLMKQCAHFERSASISNIPNTTTNNNTDTNTPYDSNTVAAFINEDEDENDENEINNIDVNNRVDNLEVESYRSKDSYQKTQASVDYSLHTLDNTHIQSNSTHSNSTHNNSTHRALVSNAKIAPFDRNDEEYKPTQHQHQHTQCQ
eukprot:gene3678-7319_t